MNKDKDEKLGCNNPQCFCTGQCQRTEEQQRDYDRWKSMVEYWEKHRPSIIYENK